MKFCGLSIFMGMNDELTDETTNKEAFLTFKELCYGLLLGKLAEGVATDALQDEILKSRIRIEKKKRELQRAKEIEKRNQRFRKDRLRAEKERRNCKN